MLTKRSADIRLAFSRCLSWLTFELERFAPCFAGLVLIASLIVAILKGLYEPLWFDELFSTLISKLPHVAEFWSFARTVPDGQPPLYYYVVSASIHLFGNDSLGLRMPSTVGYLLFCISLYWFVSRQTSRIYGLVAMLVPGITGCWYYATEGRPYGLVLGCTGFAAVSWQSTIMNRWRKIALVGLSLSLLGAFSFHYLSVLLFAPFALAELVRIIKSRKLDPAVWIALAVPFLILIPYVPVVRETRANTGILTYFYSRPAWYGSLEKFGDQFLGPSIVALLIVACIYMAVQHVAKLQESQFERQAIFNRKDVSPGITLVLSLTCLPLLGIAAGKFGTHNFYPRYVIGSMFGVAALITLVICRAFSGRKQAALVVAFVFAGVFTHTAIFELQQVRNARSFPVKTRMQGRIPKIARRDQLPIVVGGVFEFMELSYYGDPALLRRICYLSSEESALRFVGATAGERAIIRSAPYFGTRVFDYREWIRNHQTFYLFGGPSWIVVQLIEDGAHLQLLQGGPVDTLGDNADLFFRVSWASK